MNLAKQSRDLAATSTGSADSHVIRYRADIDGLRAVAVWSVIVFHISRATMTGGYLGVDMFFVLSGYLITSIIWREQQAGSFSIVQFYDRRIRRILPALLALLICTTLAASFILLPGDLVGYAKSLIATLGFVANIYFWRDTNYFSPDASTKPLLHLWSLSVEEQFYIFFPLMLALLNRYWRKNAFVAIAILTALSLLTDVELQLHGGTSPAFFLLPTRAWELGVGALLALAPSHVKIGRLLAEFLGLAGAVMLCLGLFMEWAIWILPPALPVTLGTAMLLLAGRAEKTTIFTAILGSSVFVFFGLISYSLYLWHWPLIVFATYYLTHGLSLPEIGALAMILIPVAYCSWRFVERPFRSKSLPIVRVRLSAVAGGTLLAAIAVLLITLDGLPTRLSAQAATINAAVGTNYRCPISQMFAFGASRACNMNLPSGNPDDAQVILLGNSHAQMYEPVVASVIKERNLTGLLVPLNACLPTVTANIDLGCLSMARANLNSVMALHGAEYVVIAMTWEFGPKDLVDAKGEILDNRGNKTLLAALNDLIDRLEKGGKQVIMVGPLALPNWDMPSVLSRDLAFHHPIRDRLYSPAPEFYAQFGDVLQNLTKRSDINFIRPDLVQCHGPRCDYIIDGKSLFADSNHIAAAETALFRPLFVSAIDAARARIAPSGNRKHPSSR